MRSSAPWISGAGLEHRLVAVREEAVGDALREGEAEMARVGEAREHRPARPPRPGPARRPSRRSRRISGERDRRAVADDRSVNSIRQPLRPPRSRAPRAMPSRTSSSPRPGRHAAVDPQLGAAGDHVDLLRRPDPRRRERHAEHRLEHRRQARVGLAHARDRALRVLRVLADAARGSAAARRSAGRRAGARRGARAPAPSSAARCRPCPGIEAWPATPSVVTVKRNTPFSAQQTP